MPVSTLQRDLYLHCRESCIFFILPPTSSIKEPVFVLSRGLYPLFQAGVSLLSRGLFLLYQEANVCCFQGSWLPDCLLPAFQFLLLLEKLFIEYCDYLWCFFFLCVLIGSWTVLYTLYSLQLCKKYLILNSYFLHSVCVWTV